MENNVIYNVFLICSVSQWLRILSIEKDSAIPALAWWLDEMVSKRSLSNPYRIGNTQRVAYRSQSTSRYVSGWERVGFFVRSCEWYPLAMFSNYKSKSSLVKSQWYLGQQKVCLWLIVFAHLLWCGYHGGHWSCLNEKKKIRSCRRDQQWLLFALKKKKHTQK